MADKTPVELAAQTREVTGKATRYLRRQGLLPANVYGHGKPSLAVQIDAKEFDRVLHKVGMNSMISLAVEGGARSVLVREVVRDRITGVPTHVDLQEVYLDEPVRATVPIQLRGESPAAKGGTMVLLVLDRLNLEGLPTTLPGAVHADASRLTDQVGVLHVRDLELPEGVTVQEDPDEVVAKLTVAPIAAEEAELEAAEAAEAEEAETAMPETPEGEEQT